MASAVAATAKCGDPKYFPKAPGAFKRGRSHIMNWIEDGTEFPPEAGRYHLVLNFSCGWCARLLIARELKGLQEVVSVSHTKVKIERPDGWPIEPWDAVSRKAGWKSIRDVYNWDAGGYGDGSERYGKRQLAVPVLLDLRSKRVVSNDSAQILLMLNGAFEAFSNGVELYPEHLQADIEAINDVVYPSICDGVYRCKFAATDEAYEEAYAALYAAIAFVDDTLERSGGPYLCGATLTLADLRAYSHLVRFDTIYVTTMLRPGKEHARLPARVVEWLRHQTVATPGYAAATDNHLASLGYYNQMGLANHVADVAAIYDRDKSFMMRRNSRGRRASTNGGTSACAVWLSGSAKKAKSTKKLRSTWYAASAAVPKDAAVTCIAAKPSSLVSTIAESGPA
ncbi:glutathione S-transferase [Aureococcus anophagefferens]|nr:glutathione S-transferase [Aureococcus anophagefferens]